MSEERCYCYKCRYWELAAWDYSGGEYGICLKYAAVRHGSTPACEDMECMARQEVKETDDE